MNTHGKVTVRGANMLFLTIFLLQFVVAMAGTVVFLLMGIYDENEMTEAILLFTQLFAVLLPAVLYLKVKGVEVKQVLRLRSVRPLHLFLAVVVGISGQFIAQLLNLPILIILSLLGEIPDYPIPIPRSIEELAVSLLIVAVLPAICEEIMTRGIIMKAYEIRGTKAGIILSALFFALMHGDIKNFFGPVFFGLTFGYLVVRTDSLIPGIVAHFCNNAFALLLSFLQESEMYEVPFLESLWFFLIAVLVSVVLFISAILLVRNTTVIDMKESISGTMEHIKAAFTNGPVVISIVIFIVIQISNIITMVA
ncbi:MAG: CPBP family intramembrane metalloprotease [Clostridiaceae bacterium]|nr:CPBP family intramembrane metalloprotease [Clostridiaceae bacterium]